MVCYCDYYHYYCKSKKNCCLTITSLIVDYYISLIFIREKLAEITIKKGITIKRQWHTACN